MYLNLFYLVLKVNLSIEGATGPVDIWHYDSVAYTGVVLLSDVQSMVGGKLEFAHVDKHKGLDLLAQGKPFKSETIGMYLYCTGYSFSDCLILSFLFSYDLHEFAQVLKNMFRRNNFFDTIV